MNKKRQKSDEIFTQVMVKLKNILEKKPPLAKMKEEVELMGFTIRPISGNAQIIKNIDDRQFIEALWTVGKIDFLMEKNFKHLTKPQKEIILDTLAQIQEKLILKAKVSPEMIDEFDQENPPTLMFEIFRKQPVKRNIN
jgi:hypothetical protein